MNLFPKPTYVTCIFTIYKNVETIFYYSDGTIVPANSNIALFLYAMGHNPKVFPDPEKFDPERFLSDARTNKDPFEYVPFSAGLRNCVGSYNI